MDKESDALIKYSLTIGCPLCGENNEVDYVMNHQETFICKKCGQKSIIVMSFVAMVDRSTDVRTMMLDTKKLQRRKIGGVVTTGKIEETPDSGTI